MHAALQQRKMWGREGVQEKGGDVGQGGCAGANVDTWGRQEWGSPPVLVAQASRRVPCPMPSSSPPGGYGAPQAQGHMGHHNLQDMLPPHLRCSPATHPPAPRGDTTRWWLQGGDLLDPSPGGCERDGATMWRGEERGGCGGVVSRGTTRGPPPSFLWQPCPSDKHPRRDVAGGESPSLGGAVGWPPQEAPWLG